MKTEEVIEMAEQCGIDPHDMCEDPRIAINNLEAFAKLVAAKEREAINSLAEKELLNTSALMSMPPQSSAAWNILQAIRSRGDL